MSSRRCAGCRYLRRKCPSTCILSPYFPPNDPQRFLYVHKIYGASNVSKMLQQVPEEQRAETADSLYYEASCRMNNPVYGCVGIISVLQQEIYNAQCELAKVEAEAAVLIKNNYFQAQNMSSNTVNYNQLFGATSSSTNYAAAPVAADTGNGGGGGGINEAALTPYDPFFQPQFPWD